MRRAAAATAPEPPRRAVLPPPSSPGVAGEETGRRIEVTAGRDRDPGGLRRPPAGAALRLAAGRADEQPGIVAADGPGPDQDGVGRRPLRVHPVQIGRAGQHQPVLARPVETAVQRHRRS